jgi:hypothetical protein
MRELIIKKGKHICYNDNMGFKFGSVINHSFEFTKDTIYDLNNSDQYDWCKLFGFTDCLLPRFKVLNTEDGRVNTCDFKIKILNRYVAFFRPVHWQSARFVWRWNIDKQTFESTSYCYIKGVRTYDDIIFNIPLNKGFDFKITKTFNNYYFTSWMGNIKIFDKVESAKQKTKPYGYYLGFFFGGNQSTPKEIKIKKW